MDWMAVKTWLESSSVDEDALHVYVAIGIQVAAALSARKSLGSWVPWLTVLAAGFLNEFLDVWLGHEDQVQPWQIAEGIKDMFNTMLMPTIILLLVRFAPQRLWQRRANPSGTDEAAYPQRSDGS